MTESKVLTDTVKNSRFDAITKIGFNAVNFEYLSHVSFSKKELDGVRQYIVLTQADKGSSIFNYLDSTWTIKCVSKDKCEVTYEIKLDFSNYLYAAVTRQFFEFLVQNIH